MLCERGARRVGGVRSVTYKKKKKRRALPGGVNLQLRPPGKACSLCLAACFGPVKWDSSVWLVTCLEQQQGLGQLQVNFGLHVFSDSE